MKLVADAAPDPRTEDLLSIIGFRFLEAGPQHQEVVANLRNYLFNPR
jgi:hypothetical protein